MISFKKVGSIIAIVMVFVLCVPSIPVRASSSENEFVFYSYQSVDGCLDNVDVFGRTNEEKNSIIKTIYNKNSSYYSNFYNIVSSLDSSVYGDDDLYLLYYRDSTLCYMGIDSSRAEGLVYINGYNDNPSVDSGSVSICFMYHSADTSYTPTIKAYTNSTWTDISITRYAGSGYYYYLNSSYPILYSNIKIVDYSDLSKAGHTPPSGSGKDYAWTYQDDLFDYSCNNVNLKYTDSFGNSVLPQTDPDVDEHFGFRKFDSQVVVRSTYTRDASYQALLSWETDPLGGNFVTGSAEDWKLHLDCTIDYTIGQYPDGNAIVPEKQTPGSIVFGGDLINEDLDWYKAGEYLIDPTNAADHMNNSYCHMSGSGFFVPLLAGMKGDYVRGNKNVERYGLLGDALEAIGASSSTLLGGAIIGAFNELTGSSIPNWLEEYTNTNYYYAIDAFSINIKGYLVGPSVQSQYGVANSDFVTFSSSGYAQPVTPESTESVPDPQPQQPYQQTDLPAVTPTGYDSQGNMTYVVVNIDNTDNVPSIDGNNNMSYNPTFSPSVNNSTNVDLGIDNVADTLDPLVVQENQSFWNLFNPFKDNAFIEATEDYMGIIPSQLQTIFISSFGILIGLTVYRFIRRG